MFIAYSGRLGYNMCSVTFVKGVVGFMILESQRPKFNSEEH